MISDEENKNDDFDREQIYNMFSKTYMIHYSCI